MLQGSVGTCTHGHPPLYICVVYNNIHGIIYKHYMYVYIIYMCTPLYLYVYIIYVYITHKHIYVHTPLYLYV